MYGCEPGFRRLCIRTRVEVSLSLLPKLQAKRVRVHATPRAQDPSSVSVPGRVPVLYRMTFFKYDDLQDISFLMYHCPFSECINTRRRILCSFFFFSRVCCKNNNNQT